MAKLKAAIHKLTSCSGCQLAFLNQGEILLSLLNHIEICHFVEGGIFDPDVSVDISFIEGSVTTEEEQELIKGVRERSKLVVTMGACATSGGIQALRNFSQLTGGTETMKSYIYARPEFIKTLDKTKSVSDVIKVDFELWGCPVAAGQLNSFVSQLILGAEPKEETTKLCMECKRLQKVCVLVTEGVPCLGPITRSGCGALCPSFGKACYGCYGPAEQPNNHGLANRLKGIGLVNEQIAARFAQIHNSAPALRKDIEHLLTGEQNGQKKN